MIGFSVMLMGFTQCPGKRVPPLDGQPGHGGHAGQGGDGDGAGGGTACGPAKCEAGQVCCNESCGICTEPGGFCTEQFCEPAPPTGPFCGGIAGIACPGAGTCVDDPSDDCDPERGGADCGGVCDCSGVLALCLPNTFFNEDPEVCACEPMTSGDGDGGQGDQRPDAVTCGGIAGFACPGLGMCVDDPEDDCDPSAGGADCIGACECNAAAISCLVGTVLNTDPSVCACE